VEKFLVKNKGLGLAGFGILLIIGALLSLRSPDISQWCSVLLLFGGVITCVGIGRYWAR
jgi:hypothetical protein